MKRVQKNKTTATLVPAPGGLSCRVQVSRRARHVRLKMVPHEGLVAVLPSWFDPAGLPALLESHEAWIRRAAGRLEARQRPEPALHSSGLPLRVELQGIGQYREVVGEEGRVRLHDEGNGGGGRLLVPLDRDAGRKAMQAWLRRIGSRELPVLLREVARREGLSFHSAAVRLQRSRWGSCTAKGRISLNLKLLFLPPELVHYIMVHELCHTRHLNHSAAFWSLVGRYDPDFRTHDRAMRHAWSYVPAWVLDAD